MNDAHWIGFDRDGSCGAAASMLSLDMDRHGTLTGSWAGDESLLERLGSRRLPQRGDSLDSHLQPEVAHAAASALDACARGGTTVSRTVWSGNGDGRAPIELLVAARRGADTDRPESFCVMLRQMQAGEPSFRKLAEVARLTTNLVVVTDAERRIEWVNEAFTRTTGFTLAQALGRRPGELLQFEGTDPRTIAAMRDALDARRPIATEVLNRSKTGRRYWLSLDIHPITTREGHLEGFVAVQSDITALKQTGAEAMAHRQLTMEASQDAVATADEAGRLTYVNPAFAKTFEDKGKAAWPGREWWQLYPLAEQAATRTAATAALARQGKWTADLQSPRADGTVADHELSLSQAPDGTLVLVAHEVGELKRHLRTETTLHNLLMTVVPHCLNAPFEQVDAAINAALGRLAAFIGADRGYLFRYDWEAGTASNTHEWYAEGAAPRRHALQEIVIERFSDWVALHRAGQRVVVPDAGALAAGDALRARLEKLQIRSLVSIPLMNDGRCDGFLGFDSMRGPREFSDRECQVLEFFSEVARNLLDRARLERTAEEYRDRLRREEERRSVQEAVIQVRVDAEAKMAGALVEMRRLRDRDQQMREDSELVVRALRSLSESQDPVDGPQHLLEHLCQAMRTSCAALLPLTDRDELLCIGNHAPWWSRVLEDQGLVQYLAERPSRMIGDLSASPVFRTLRELGPLGRLQWLAVARIGSAERASLLVLGGSSTTALDGSGYQRFQRFVPLMGAAMRRREDSIRARKLEQDLQHAQKLEALGNLAGSVAHEINTPMQYISDNLHFLQEAFADLIAALSPGRAPAEGRAAGDLEYLISEIPLALEQSIGGSRRVAEIVEAVRTAAYPDLAPEERIDVRATIEHCMVITRGQWKHDVDVRLRCEGTIPTLRGKPGQISQVFVNLITNACDAVRTTEGERARAVHITLSTESAEVVARVEDSGPGIPQALRERVFDRFYTTKGVGEGMGRGLDICRGIVEQHGGSIVIEEAALGGACFTVRLPVRA